MTKTFDQGRAEVVRLCQQFATNRERFLAPRTKEADVRQSLIDPFFEALGWDVHNRSQHAPQNREVVPEESLDVEGAQRAPDYAFRLGTQPRFYVEAKKCGVNIQGDPVPAYQLRRYGWSAKVALSILTDFEELSVYDCTIRPREGDKASKARILYLRCEEYADRWRELWDVFSREAVWSGAYDQYAASKRKRGTSEVDVEFLKEIEGWREALARNFANRNDELSPEDLNAAVQRTIDRIVFLRMAEDRGLEPEDQLLKLSERPEIYSRFMRDLCRKADEKYNSGLFHFHKEDGVSEAPDRITPKLELDDRVLKPILQGLYFAHGSPYHFGVLPVEILGTVYERFLGKVIRLTAGHQAKIEEKPEVRKAGGVYYTPAYIVDYIVRETVGRQIEGRSPAQLAGGRGKAPFRVLDMACGSGSFLLGAYQCLLEYALKWYLENRPETHVKAVYREQRSREWRLTIEEKKRLLTAHLFGVDIDPQAVEVSKLSLLLKALEGESDATLSQQLTLFEKHRALPNLAENIKCGNSLIGPDYFTGRLIPEPEEMKRVNPFDWNHEFPEAMQAGGFDCIIGNPPWGQKEIDGAEATKQYIRDHYPSTAGIYDLFRPFVEHAVRMTRPEGHWGMVLPDIVLLKDYPETRAFLLNEIEFTRMDWWGMAFADAVIDAATLIGRRRKADAEHLVHVTVRDEASPLEHDLLQASFWKNERLTFNLRLTNDLSKVLTRLRRNPALGEFFEVHEGIHSGNIRAALFVESRVDESCRELLFGRDEIRPYFLAWNGKYVRLSAMPRKKTRAKYANIGRMEWYERDKILVRRTGDYILSAVDRTHRFASNNFFILFPKSGEAPPLDAVAAILNSGFMTWYFRAVEPRKGRAFAEVKIKHLTSFPLPSPSKVKEYSELAELGEQRAALAATLARKSQSSKQASATRQADYLERQIDSLVLDALEVPARTRNAIISDREQENGQG